MFILFYRSLMVHITTTIE